MKRAGIGWEHFDHRADIGVRGWGRTMAEAFEQTAMAMTGVVVDPGTISLLQAVDVVCEAEDHELLLVDWLNSVLCEMSARQMLFGSFHVEIQSTRLQAKAWGERVDPVRHRPAVEVKGASYLALEVVCDHRGGWLAQCVVDV